MPDNRNCVITFRMNQEDSASLRRFAAEREMSMAAAVRYFIKKGMAIDHEQTSIALRGRPC